jgi:hypothetical protein
MASIRGYVANTDYDWYALDRFRVSIMELELGPDPRPDRELDPGLRCHHRELIAIEPDPAFLV